MIHLITLNPAIDEYIDVTDFQLGRTSYRNRTTKVMGGKAVNVATVLRNLGLDATLVTTIDRKNSFVVEHLQSFNSFLIDVDSVRTNLKINDNGHVTEINDRGTALSGIAKLQFENYITKCVENGDIVLIAGNPHFEDEQFQYKLAKLAKDKGAKLFLDSNKFDLEMIKALCPYFIKPNDEELEALFKTPTTGKALTEYCHQVIVSHGSKGFTYFDRQSEQLEQPISGKPINTVGAGDSLVAGYIYGEATGLELGDKLLIAKYCASATVYTGVLATKQAVQDYDKTNILK